MSGAGAGLILFYFLFLFSCFFPFFVACERFLSKFERNEYKFYIETFGYTKAKTRKRTEKDKNFEIWMNQK